MPSLGDWTTRPIYNDHANNPWNDKELDISEFVELELYEDSHTIQINGIDYKYFDISFMVDVLQVLMTKDKTKECFDVICNTLEETHISIEQLFEEVVQYDEDEWDSDLMYEAFIQELKDAFDWRDSFIVNLRFKAIN